MRKAISLEIGKRYYDQELDDYFYIVSFKTGKKDCLVKYDGYARAEVFEYADMLSEAFIDEPEALVVPIKSLNSDSIIPAYKTEGAAGFDLSSTHDVTIIPGASATISTGISFELPVSHELEIRGRSGNGFNHDVWVFNGTVDSDYTGEVKIRVINLGADTFEINKGDRVAQGIIKKVEQVTFIESDILRLTARGTKGFGSSGV